jgi:hypothetical protein
MTTAAKLHCDILVVGGGAAGVAAAVAAARSGADAILVERHSALGGKATAAQVGTVCGLYHSSLAARPRYLDEGFACEFAQRLIARSGSGPLGNRLGLHYLPYRAFDFARICDRLVEESGVRVFLHTAVGRLTADARLREIEALALDRPVRFVPRAVVDCSGEALCSSLGGEAPIIDAAFQTPSQVFAMEGVAPGQPEEALGAAILRALQDAAGAGDRDFIEALVRVTIVPGSVAHGHVGLKLNLPIEVGDDLNKASALEMAARAAVDRVAAQLVERVPAFAGARLGEVAPEIGIRTGRRSPGRKRLVREHVLACRKDPDSAARGAWPIEKWGLGRKLALEVLAMEDYYDIPHGCLASARFDNLFFGGRHLCADEDAIASARVIGTCLATGFAAGRMALAVD